MEVKNILKVVSKGFEVKPSKNEVIISITGSKKLLYIMDEEVNEGNYFKALNKVLTFNNILNFELKQMTNGEIAITGRGKSFASFVKFEFRNGALECPDTCEAFFIKPIENRKAAAKAAFVGSKNITAIAKLTIKAINKESSDQIKEFENNKEIVA